MEKFNGLEQRITEMKSELAATINKANSCDRVTCLIDSINRLEFWIKDLTITALIKEIQSNPPALPESIYNNVFDCNGSGGGVHIADTGNIVKNNIIYNTGDNVSLLWNVGSYGTTDYNCYEANDAGDVIHEVGVGNYTLAEWQAHSGEDANSFVADPKFVDP